MSQAKIIVYVKFPDWDSFTEPVKSLINFYMKNASLIFEGNYSSEGVFHYMSGNFVFNQYYLMDVYGEDPYWTIMLDIPYLGEDENPEDIDETNMYLPLSHTTLEQRQTCLKLCSLRYGYVIYNEEGVSPLDNISVILTPKIGEEVITRPTFRPKSLDEHASPNAQYHTTGIPIQVEDLDFNYNFQLRSSSFYIEDGEGEIEADVFYKIGICPVNGKYDYWLESSPELPGLSLSEIVNLLKEDNLQINSLVLDDVTELYYKLLQGRCVYSWDYINFNNPYFYGFTKSLIIPIINEDNQLIGIAYAELYNQDGTLFEGDVTDKTILLYARPSEQGTPVLAPLGSRGGLPLLITDQSLDSGFILTPIEPSVTATAYTVPYSATDGGDSMTVYTENIEVTD